MKGRRWCVASGFTVRSPSWQGRTGDTMTAETTDREGDSHDEPCSDSVHYHQDAEPEGGMGPHCGVECCYCSREFPPEYVAADEVRFGEDCGAVEAEGWACRGCIALELLHTMRDHADDPEALTHLLEGDWP
jgi:hypothetical protein